MVSQKIIFQIVLDNVRYRFRVLFVLNVIYMVLRRDQMYHNLGLSIISNFSLIYLEIIYSLSRERMNRDL